MMIEILLALVSILGLLYYYFTVNFDYWKKRGVPYVEPTIFFGNLKDQILLRKPTFLVVNDIYHKLTGKRFGGYFESRNPVLMVRDPKLVEQVIIKDFSNFYNREFGQDTVSDPLSGNLFSLKGQTWRNLRNKIIPTFTTGKLKGMFDQMCNGADELMNEIEKSILEKEAREAKKLGFLFAINVTASVSFGLQFNMNSPEGIEFRKMVDRAFSPSKWRVFEITILLYFSKLAKLLKIRIFPKEVSDYIANLVKATMQYRVENNVQRNDFLQLMMNLQAQEASGKVMNWKSELSEEDAYLNQMDYTTKDGHFETGTKMITDECITAQSLVFLTGGAEATASSVAFTLYELACNPEVQKRLQQEVDSVFSKHGGKLTYEGLKEMTYLDMVIQEKSRKYTEGGSLIRVCEIPYTIPGTDVLVEKGTKVLIPVQAIHNDPEHYPEPNKFIPERFEGNNHRTSGTYLPFGDGPRVCIGMRFVILEMKACISKVMSKYSVSLDSRTKTPLTFDPRSFQPFADGGIWVKFEKRTQSLS